MEDRARQRQGAAGEAAEWYARRDPRTGAIITRRDSRAHDAFFRSLLESVQALYRAAFESEVRQEWVRGEETIDAPVGTLASTKRSDADWTLTDGDGGTVILVTHDLRSAEYGDRIITLRDRQIVDEVAGVQLPNLVPVRGR